MKNKRLMIFILFAIALGAFLLFNYLKGGSQSITKTITPVICVKGEDKIMSSGMPAEISGSIKNERFLFSEMEWLKSFKGQILIEGVKYSFETFYVGNRTYNCFAGRLVWQEFGEEQKSIITFNKQLDAFQFAKADGRLINGPSKDLEAFHRLFSFFTSTPRQ